MNEEKYRVVFEGRVAEGQDLGLVKKRLASIFKTDIKNVEKMFKGRTVIKKNVPLETCKKVRLAFGKAGAVCKIVPEETISFDINEVEPEEEKPAAAPKKPKAKKETTEERPPYIALVVFAAALVIAGIFGNRGIISGVACINAIWVYLDATKRNIGRVPGEKGLLNMSAGSWAFGTFLLWIIIFPLYVFKRPKLEKKARQKPIAPSKFKRVAALSFMGLFTCLFFLGGVALIIQNQGTGQSQGHASAEQPATAKDKKQAPGASKAATEDNHWKRETIRGKVYVERDAGMFFFYVGDVFIDGTGLVDKEVAEMLFKASDSGEIVEVDGQFKMGSDGKVLNTDARYTVSYVNPRQDNSMEEPTDHPGVGLVKSAVYSHYGGTAIGTLLDASFDNPQWRYEQTDKGQHHVIFEGNVSKQLQKDACDFAGITVEDLEASRDDIFGPYYWKVGEPAKIIFEISERGNHEVTIKKIESRAWSHPIAPTTISDLLKVLNR
jgi:hypothetical protein